LDRAFSPGTRGANPVRMKCLQCGGGLEYVQNAQFARCSHCCALYRNDNRHLSPIGPPDPDGSAAYAVQLGFQPRKANYTVVGLGGGVNLKINSGKMERDVKNKVSSMIWGWVIGAVILGVMVLVGGGIGIWVWMQSRDMSASANAAASPAAAKTAKWDGASPFSCGGAEVVKIEKVKASLASGTAISAAGNCQLTLVDVDVSAPLPIDATGNAKVTVTGGSLKGAPEAIVAGANATVAVTGATVTGKTKASGNGKITGVK
jgi:hypothetical protein